MMPLRGGALSVLALVVVSALQAPGTVCAVRHRADDRALRAAEQLRGVQQPASARKPGQQVVSDTLVGAVFDLDHDPLEQVIDFIVWQEEKYRNETEAAVKAAPLLGDNASVAMSLSSSFLEVSAEVGKVHAFCEICVLIMQMKERGQPHLCAGLNPDYFISCVENLESLLRADKAVVYWLRSGCMHLDREGPEIVRCVRACVCVRVRACACACVVCVQYVRAWLASTRTYVCHGR
jgi:hypothetical protein